MTERLFAQAKKIKGYGSYSLDIPIKEIQKIKTLESGLKVKPKVIKNLVQYLKFINKLKMTYENPIFYRGQTNANYLLIPSSLRIDPNNEDRMIESFSRRFSDEINRCNGSMAKLVLMQHFGLGTRCLDITENPLAALYFACQPMKKFRKPIIVDKESDYVAENEAWGEVILFQEPNSKEEKRPEKLKNIESSNVSIMANTAFLEKKFSLWHLGVRWKNDVNQGHDERYIDLKSIVRGSLIVRVPQTNPRIKNQQGAFIVVNANKVWVEDRDSYLKELTNHIISSDYETFENLRNTSEWKDTFEELKTWKLHFEKIKPYDESNEIELFRTDPFDISRLFYKKSNAQQLILIPPDAKQGILEELRRLNITEDFIYPDMDTVANEINENINKKEEIELGRKR